MDTMQARAEQPMDADSIPGRTQVCAESLDALDNYISRLESRLAEVTIPAESPPEGSLDKIRVQRSTHGEMLLTIAERVQGAGRRLSSLLDHLDL
jgi:hypothetical protein